MCLSKQSVINTNTEVVMNLFIILMGDHFIRVHNVSTLRFMRQMKESLINMAIEV